MNVDGVISDKMEAEGEEDLPTRIKPVEEVEVEVSRLAGALRGPPEVERDRQPTTCGESRPPFPCATACWPGDAATESAEKLKEVGRPRSCLPEVLLSLMVLPIPIKPCKSDRSRVGLPSPIKPSKPTAASASAKPVPLPIEPFLPLDLGSSGNL